MRGLEKFKAAEFHERNIAPRQWETLSTSAQNFTGPEHPTHVAEGSRNAARIIRLEPSPKGSAR
jgi:hypothetical protein